METETSERWPALLPAVARLLEHYRTRENATLRLGGGTSLTFFVDHRLSFDLDLSVGDPPPRPGHLQRLMASRLPQSLTDDVRYPGDFVKLVWNEIGEVDLLAASPLTPHAGIPVWIGDIALCLEHPEEVVAKKLAYRAATAGGMKGRDIYDIHACLEAGIVRASNLASLVGPERFDTILEALDYDTDRIMGEIGELSQRSLDPAPEDLHRSLSTLACASPSSDFAEYEPVLNVAPLASRLRLRVEGDRGTRPAI